MKKLLDKNQRFCQNKITPAVYSDFRKSKHQNNFQKYEWQRWPHFFNNGMPAPTHSASR